jgi:hypothetical protein
VAAGPVPVRIPLIPVVAVAVPAGQALERGPGRLPVTPAAGRLAAGLATQQPIGVNLVRPLSRQRRPSPGVAAVMGSPATAAALPILTDPGGSLASKSRSPSPHHRWSAT